MIDARELRIGNLFLLGEGNINRVESIVETTQEFYNISVSRTDQLRGLRYTITSDKLEPIPLSPELLIKCGFVEDKSLKYSQGFDIFKPIRLRVYLGDHNSVHIQPTSEAWYPQLCVLQHLHQLQNLYHSLTQTELNIEL